MLSLCSDILMSVADTQLWSSGEYSKLKADGLPSRVEKATLAPESGVMSEYSEVHRARSSFTCERVPDQPGLEIVHRSFTNVNGLTVNRSLFERLTLTMLQKM